MRRGRALYRLAATVPIPKEDGEMKNTRACRNCRNENAEGWNAQTGLCGNCQIESDEEKRLKRQGTEIPVGTAVIANPKEGVGIIHSTSGCATIATFA